MEHWLFVSVVMPVWLVPPRFSGSGNARRGVAAGAGTLLGPEETGTGALRASGFRLFGPLRILSAWLVDGVWADGLAGPLYRISSEVSGSDGFGGGCWLVSRSCFENCIVNASILFFLLCSSFLGHTVDALASGADEGRGSLRYAPGSWQPSVDPGVSEWGNPAPVMGCCRHLNV